MEIIKKPAAQSGISGSMDWPRQGKQIRAAKLFLLLVLENEK